MDHEIILSGIRDEGIRINIEKIHTNPDLKLTGYEDCFGTISIRAGYFSTSEPGPLWTSMNALAQFCRELDACWHTLSGDAGHATYENNLMLTLSMTEHGHGIVRGSYHPDFTTDNILQFSFETDQTYLAQTIRCLRHFLNSAADSTTI